MLYNYVKIAWRNLLKYKLFSFINIIGLGLAIPSALMALIQIVNYYEYDNFHRDSGRIVRVITDEKTKDGGLTNWASSPVRLADYIRENLTGVGKATTLIREQGWTLSSSIKTKDIKVIYCDKSFFEIFNFPLAKGSYALEPNTIVLSDETAQWYFNDINPIGQLLDHPTYGSFKVVGVLKPFNQQKTQFRTDVFVPIANYPALKQSSADWSLLNAHTFLKIPEGMAVAKADEQLAVISARINTLTASSAGNKLLFKAQPLAAVSPAKGILKNDPYVQDIRSIYINFGFQLIILLLASLNYINLTLARSMNRSREVGVRKVAGATRMQLVFQFLTESVLVSYIALGIGLLLLWVIKRYIHVSWLTWDIDHTGYLILLFVLFNLLTGVIAGASPSLILSSFQPVKVLKGAVLPVGLGKIGFRKSLIVFQFTVALAYLFFIGHAYHQLSYMANDNENYRRENILTISLHTDQYKPFEKDINSLKDVQHTGYTSRTFGNKPAQTSVKNSNSETGNKAWYYAADNHFISTMGLTFVAGNNLTASHAEKASPLILVNQKAVEKLGLGTAPEAIGKMIVVNDTLTATIIGVVADFCHYDYEREPEPVVFQYNPSLFNVMCLKTNPVSDRKILEAQIKEIWGKYNPHQDINMSWFDTDMYERYYPYDFMQFLGMQSMVIFVIAMLGLTGILTYSLEKRRKEISIRKSIGATTADIIKLMSADFIKLLAAATLIATPIGVATGLYMNSYMTFNDGLSYSSMGVLLLLVLSFASGVVGYFSWAAAQANPAKILKTE
nr:ABC transporter permease [uncultured Arsenicibacter sp.]